ncbi:hypothetical protein [Streptomyces sp. NPDC058382]|uniref:hypothetical protein n=1 Tax=unclassified Streptomyces TaxID=2593676 RepID=UPI00363C0AA1
MTWHSAAVPDARLHPLVRDTSRPTPGPDLLAFTELAARLLKSEQQKPPGRPAAPEGPPTWQLLAPHAAKC